MPGLMQWLEALNLKDAYQKFLNAGYDELDDMIKTIGTAWEITMDDLKDIGIDKPGYRHRILSKLKEDACGYPQRNREKKREVLFEKYTNSVACEYCVIS